MDLIHFIFYFEVRSWKNKKKSRALTIKNGKRTFELSINMKCSPKKYKFKQKIQDCKKTDSGRKKIMGLIDQKKSQTWREWKSQKKISNFSQILQSCLRRWKATIHSLRIVHPPNALVHENYFKNSDFWTLIYFFFYFEAPPWKNKKKSRSLTMKNGKRTFELSIYMKCSPKKWKFKQKIQDFFSPAQKNWNLF